MAPAAAAFDATLALHGLPPLARGRITTLQVNVGKLCNLACHHCHVEAGPKRTEAMSRAVAQRALALLEASPEVELLDLTGGAPEMNPHFEFLVAGARALGRRVIDRCNLTIFFEEGYGWLPQMLRRDEVEIVASLPCYTAENVDRQRGRGVFGGSIRALQLLNELGYGRPGSPHVLDLVYNPVGAFLPPPQEVLEEKYREELRRLFGIEFHRLYTITNMPIKRFGDWLLRRGEHARYMSLLVHHFNPATVPALMCRAMVSVGWDGRLYDCDFNQMLDLEIPEKAAGRPLTVFDVARLSELEGGAIRTGSHCYGCTAGAGSTCGGAIL
ncbi:MAG TPA: arsenosugar biosynthesis radical SAM (seleno)protein ArsS [Planctomycetota bacterium]|jgi:radical SAM/Cys-rich protein|nr:arsenosugar biosynthesis radical SAM (seleno)protein ArsS [Planctomycetota bacterium]